MLQVFESRCESFETAKIFEQTDQACDVEFLQKQKLTKPLCDFYIIMCQLWIIYEAASNIVESRKRYNFDICVDE